MAIETSEIIIEGGAIEQKPLIRRVNPEERMSNTDFPAAVKAGHRYIDIMELIDAIQINQKVSVLFNRKDTVDQIMDLINQYCVRLLAVDDFINDNKHSEEEVE